jgi:putative endonuclease
MERLNKSDWCVYVLKCRNNYLYIGITNDIDARMKAHANGTGSKFVRTWRPFELVKIVPCKNSREARSLEYQLKRLRRVKKIKILELEVGSIARKGYSCLKSNVDLCHINALLNDLHPSPKRNG